MLEGNSSLQGPVRQIARGYILSQSVHAVHVVSLIEYPSLHLLQSEAFGPVHIKHA